MTKIAYAVIGAGYGDEGKGLVTDVITRMLSGNVTVARGNGGAQAGHTVVDGNKRHIFNSIGAGTFAGASTYWSSQFLVNPGAVKKELQTLSKMGVRPVIQCHPDARITTPYDVFINQAIERTRGSQRHGSCGMGINETVTRDLAGYSLRMSDYMLVPDLLDIRNDWVKPRLATLGLDTEENLQFVDSLDINAIADEIIGLRNYTSQCSTQDYMRSHLVVEGAQGLLLDEHLGKFPHVTRSNTGLMSAIKTAAEYGKTEIIPVYVTRCYSTRHGAGELLNEGTRITDTELFDATNVENEWQQHLRYAPLDFSSLNHIQKDLDRSIEFAKFFNVNIRPAQLVVTCLDQMGADITMSKGGISRAYYTESFADTLAYNLGLKLFGTSHGESAATFKLA